MGEGEQALQDICVPRDENVHTQEKRKKALYVQLAVALARMYPNYQYEIVPIVLGATGLVTESLVTNLKELKFTDKSIKDIIPRTQRKALIGSMRIMKAAEYEDMIYKSPCILTLGSLNFYIRILTLLYFTI